MIGVFKPSPTACNEIPLLSPRLLILSNLFSRSHFPTPPNLIQTTCANFWGAKNWQRCYKTLDDPFHEGHGNEASYVNLWYGLLPRLIEPFMIALTTSHRLRARASKPLLQSIDMRTKGMIVASNYLSAVGTLHFFLRMKWYLNS